ncbi:MAG: hypothetical protein Q8880_08850, partial [Bacteroidota bacterium]|nr:hypothetical protein [Bacteroidota bacterium]
PSGVPSPSPSPSQTPSPLPSSSPTQQPTLGSAANILPLILGAAAIVIAAVVIVGLAVYYMKLINKLRFYRWKVKGKLSLKKKIHSLEKTEKLKVILGNGGTKFKGWIETDLPHMNILNRKDWEYLFDIRKPDNLLAEHVLEHLTIEEVEIVLQNVFKYLKNNGIFRIAVPDSYNPDLSYIERVKQGGIVGESIKHKSFWNIDSLSEIATKFGFIIEPIEYYTSNREFIYNGINKENGPILRYKTKESDNENDASLIVDLKKNLKNIKFYITPYENPQKSMYHYIILALAQGFKEMGYNFCGNIDYWFESDKNEYLIKKGNINITNTISIYTSIYFIINPYEINNVDYNKINILTDHEDGLYTSCYDKKFKKFDIILKCHYNKNIKYPKNVIPWAYGLDNRIISELKKTENNTITERVYNNFRVPHNLRETAVKISNNKLSKKYEIFNNITDSLDNRKETDPKSLWSQTGRRHNPEYYKLLNESLISYVYGGILTIKPTTLNFKSKILRKIYQILIILNKNQNKTNKYYYIYQYDSWRFWEGLLSNSCPIDIDFDYWGFELPVMPINKKHYWGISDLNFSEIDDFLKLSKEEIIEISQNGKKWALENYSPLAVAQRLIKTLHGK